MVVKTRQMIALCVVLALALWTSTVTAQDTEDEDPTPPEASEASDDGSRASGADQPAAGSVEQYALAELTARAVTNSELMAEFKERRAQAKWDQYKAEHAWSPKISSTTTAAPVPANADPDRFEENIDEFLDLEIGPFVREDLNVVVPVYTFGRVSTAKELAELGIENSKLVNEKQRLDIIFETKRAYYSLRLANAFQEMLEEGEELIEEQLEEMQDARDFGEADFDIKDLRKLQIFSAEVDSRVVDNARLASIAQAGLRFLADIDDDVQIQVPKLDDLDTPPELRDRGYYVDQALRHHPEINQLDKAVEARRLEHQLEKAGWYPNLAFAFSMGLAWSTEETALQDICRRDASGDCNEVGDLFAEPYGDPLNGFSVRIGLALRWNIDPFQQHADVEKKDSQRRQIIAQRQRARNALKLEVTRRYREAADAREKIDIDQRRLNAAVRWRNQFGLSAQTAGGDMSEAIDPLKAFYEARARYLETVYDYLIARAELARTVGAPGLGPDGTATVH